MQTILPGARRHLEKGQYDRALEEYLSYFQKGGTDLRVWQRIAEVHLKRGHTDRATEAYEKAARGYAGQGFAMKAVAIYKQILASDPKRLDAHLELAELYRAQGLLAETRHQLEIAARAYAGTGRVREALEARRRMADLDPDAFDPHLTLADELVREGMSGEAKELLQAVAERARAAGRIEIRTGALERLVRLEPDEGMLHRALAAAYLEGRHPSRAAVALRRTFDLDPRNLETLSLLGEAFRALGQSAKVVQVLSQMAAVHHERGEAIERDALYARILEIDPDDAVARRALRRSGLGLPRPSVGMPSEAAAGAPLVFDEEIVIGGEHDAEAPAWGPLARRS